MTRPKTRTTGDILRDARVVLRFTQIDFAVELGIARRTLSRWEADVTRPQPDELPWIVQVFKSHNGALGERVAIELGIAAAAGSRVAALDESLILAAASVSVPKERLRDALKTLTAKWRDAGATLEDVIGWLAS